MHRNQLEFCPETTGRPLLPKLVPEGLLAGGCHAVPTQVSEVSISSTVPPLALKARLVSARCCGAATRVRGKQLRD